MTKKTKNALLACEAVVFCVVVAVAIYALREYVERAEEGNAAGAVFEAMKAQGTQAAPSSGISTILIFYTGRLEGGRGIILENNDAAMWLKDGELFVVNENARALLPQSLSAPASITYEAVLAVAD